MELDWTHELVEQLDWHWRTLLRPRLDGLTDDEYFDEPVPGCWNIRARGTSNAPVQGGSGEFLIEFAMPEPDPPGRAAGVGRPRRPLRRGSSAGGRLTNPRAGP